VQYAIDEEISIEASVFDKEWQKMLSKNPQLADYVKTPQVSKLKADIYLNLLARKAEALSVDQMVTITDEEVAAYYATNKAKFFRPKLFTASHVFVKVDPSDNAEEKQIKQARAEELFKRALAGEDFYNLAYYESDDRSKYVGGSLGSFHAGQTVSEFDAAIQQMKPGEIAGPVRTMYGFHVIKLDKVDDERQLQFEEVSAKIRTSLVESERDALYKQWMSNLKEKYPLERLDQ
jgi:parvulin-like peptidyl-prolyl isomerase